MPISHFSLIEISMLFSLLWAVIEWWGANQFSPFFFRIGIPVFRRRLIGIGAFPNSARPGRVIKKEEGEFLPDEKGNVLFQSHWPMFRFNRTRTPFPFRITGLRIQSDEMDIVARIPTGPVLFLLIWMSNWVIQIAGTHQIHTSPLHFLVLGFVVPPVILVLGCWIEKRRMDVMITELRLLTQNETSPTE